MKKRNMNSGIVCVTLVVAACNNAEETEPANEMSSNGEENIEQTESINNEDEGNDNESGEEMSDEYTEEEVTGDFLIYSDRTEPSDLMFYFTRTTDEMTREELFEQSLIESDPSQDQLLSTMTNFEVDGTVVNLYFDENDNLSMASTESDQFWEVLHEIGFRFGIDEINLFNQDGERGLTFAENIWEEPIEIEQEPTRGYYVMSEDNSERGEYTYISGAVAEEEIYTEDDDLLDFGKTIEEMASVENDDGSYYSGIYEGLEIEEATINGNQATVRYHINEDVEAPEQEREDFEQVIQLAALDFQVEELEIVNETDRVISVYPLLKGISDSDSAANDDSNSEDTSDMNGQEENMELTEDDVPGIVFDYVNEHEDFESDDLRVGVDREDDEGNFIAQVFVFSGEEGEAQMTNTLAWYLVDKETGEVEER
ncbi:hypothetical protein ACM26V_03745 [Salipaludibacillus sp. HK11]|uniref:hypothetical protein n=1 Tax=Salipaludibacillus sp. HK11 TaxID=3394320 RepID=UPI0039FCDAD3